VPTVRELVQEEVKNIVSKYVSMINEKVSSARYELLTKIEELRKSLLRDQ